MCIRAYEHTYSARRTKKERKKIKKESVEENARVERELRSRIYVNKCGAQLIPMSMFSPRHKGSLAGNSVFLQSPKSNLNRSFCANESIVNKYFYLFMPNRITSADSFIFCHCFVSARVNRIYVFC